jgi:L-rhamnose mutarotase
MLPKMFASYFRHNINHYATFIDPKRNQFEVLIKKINGNIYLTHG